MDITDKFHINHNASQFHFVVCNRKSKELLFIIFDKKNRINNKKLYYINENIKKAHIPSRYMIHFLLLLSDLRK